MYTHVVSAAVLVTPVSALFMLLCRGEDLPAKLSFTNCGTRLTPAEYMLLAQSSHQCICENQRELKTATPGCWVCLIMQLMSHICTWKTDAFKSCSKSVPLCASALSLVWPHSIYTSLHMSIHSPLPCVSPLLRRTDPTLSHNAAIVTSIVTRAVWCYSTNS